jgi:hypothetical protein
MWSNSLRAAEESDQRHPRVMEAMRKLMSEFPVSVSGPNFRLAEYIDKQGKPRRTIEMSELAVRTITRSDDRWFVAKDVCHPDAFDIGNVSQAVARLDPDEKDSICFTDAIGRSHEMLVVSFQGLCNLSKYSNKPGPKRFWRWVTHEVLPAASVLEEIEPLHVLIHT